MQEQVEENTKNLAVNTTKLTGRVMWAAFRAYLRHRKEKKLEKAVDDVVTGRMSLKELVGQNQGVSSAEIADGTFKDFLKCANQVGVDYAITKDKSVTPPKYTVFFKARDSDALQEVMNRYAKMTMDREKSPSVLKELNRFKELVASLPKKMKTRTKVKEQSL
ncbi:MAG: PcfB family protein [Pseudobutyrivibrio sp.]|nr:PcfB family protein [Pseudobutyrivibrio sp.]MCF0185891.1 PcfB family protein [Bacteroidaceae bacterium]